MIDNDGKLLTALCKSFDVLGAIQEDNGSVQQMKKALCQGSVHVVC